MSFTDLTFVFLFLPVSLGLYAVVPEKGREALLVLLSLAFYALCAPQYAPLFALAVGVTVLLGRLLACTRSAPLRKALLFLGCAGNLALLAVYKYADFALEIAAALTGREPVTLSLLAPLGLSYLSFKGISYLADIYRGTAALAASPVHDLLYLSFFTQVIAGPLSRYNDFARPEKKARRELLTRGVWRFLIGFNKKVLLADVLGKLTAEIFSTQVSELPAGLAWLGAVGYSLQLFFDFAGYSDMAIGLTALFGFRCPENFLYPYTTPSVARFWRLWHVTLGAWFRDYVYIPLGGSRRARARVLLNLFAVWALTGLWHGAAWQFVAWGLGYFVLIAFERLSGLPGKLRTGFGRGLYRAFTLAVVAVQWVMFRSESFTAGLRYIGRMFTAFGLDERHTLFLLGDYGAFLLAGLVLSLPVVPWVTEKLKPHPKAALVWEGLLSAGVLALFVWALSFIVAGQNNPFAYANF